MSGGGTLRFVLLAVAFVRLQGPVSTSRGSTFASDQNDSSAFRPLDLPRPNDFRDSAGKPGRRYWQQRVNYRIDAVLDTTRQTITGQEVVEYINHSPDTLRALWFQLDQNIYRPDSRGAALFPDLAKGGGPDFHGGYEIDSVAQAARGLVTTIQGTLMRVDLARAIAPGDSARIRVAYHFQVPEHGSRRMGRTRYAGGWMYGIAQWYPRLAVYDDLRGWNLDEYAGQGEFYLEYGDIDVAITVPRGFIVAGSGTLTNPDDILTRIERDRLARAIRSDTTIAVIARNDAGSPSTRPTGSGPLTWRYTAKNVRDASWAASPAFM